METLRPLLQDYVVSHDLVYQALLETLVKFASDRVSLYGREELFSHPEFKNDTESLLRVMRMLDDASIFKSVSEDYRQEKENLLIKIGEVNNNPDVAMVTAKIRIGDEGENTIALVGPKRMDYDKALSALEYLVDELNSYFKKDGGDDHE